MTIEKLLKFIKAESGRLQKKYKVKDPSIKILGRMAKLTEEVGELSSEILAAQGFQRKEKLDRHTKEAIGHEIADVIICTLLIAEYLDIDAKKSLESKISKIEKRHLENP